jgi:glutamate carboxypeptidase
MTSLDRAEQMLMERVARDGPEMLDHVERWASISSASSDLKGLQTMADELAGAFGSLGGKLALKEPAAATRIDADGRERPARHGRNLHLVQRPDAEFRVLLTGHMDTVFGADHPFKEVRRVDNRTLSGPGVADMKGGLAIMLAALKAAEEAVADAGLSRSFGYEVVINSDEEVSSPGSAPLIAGAARRCHAGLTYEPSMPDGALAGARAGSGNFSAVITGRAAHAGRNPGDGRNAVAAAADLALRLERFASVQTGVTANIARIEGGGPNNMVPDRAVLRFNVRVQTGDQQRNVERAVREAVVGVETARGVTVSLHGGFARPPKPLDTRQLKLFECVRSCGDDLGVPISWRATGGVCDGNNIAAAGVPVVDTLGARGGGIHSAGEYLLVDSLVERAQLSALLLMRLATAKLRP